MTQRAKMADPAVLNALLSRIWKPFWPDEDRQIQVHPAAFSFEPSGNRILVVGFPSPESFGGLVLPKSAVEHAGLGVVMGIGADAFITGSPHPGASLIKPEDLLYRTVAYGSYAGKSLRLEFTKDGSFSSQVYLMTDRDVWCVRFPENGHPYQFPFDYLEVT